MSALLFPIAHAGHWINGALYLSPVVIIALLLWWQGKRDKRRDAEEARDDAAPLPDDGRPTPPTAGA